MTRKKSGAYTHGIVSTYKAPLSRVNSATQGPTTVEFSLKVAAFGSAQTRRIRVAGDVVDVFDAVSGRWWLGHRLSRSEHARVIAERDRILTTANAE